MFCLFFKSLQEENGSNRTTPEMLENDSAENANNGIDEVDDVDEMLADQSDVDFWLNSPGSDGSDQMDELHADEDVWFDAPNVNGSANAMQNVQEAVIAQISVSFF